MTSETTKPKATRKAREKHGGIRSVNLPRDVRDTLRQEARNRGISMSALGREIMEEYVDGKLVVPSSPGPQLVSTSLWVAPELWAKFITRSESNEHSMQWIFRTWLDRERPAA